MVPKQEQAFLDFCAWFLKGSAAKLKFNLNLCTPSSCSPSIALCVKGCAANEGAWSLWWVRVESFGTGCPRPKRERSLKQYQMWNCREKQKEVRSHLNQSTGACFKTLPEPYFCKTASVHRVDVCCCWQRSESFTWGYWWQRRIWMSTK